ncbi:delta-lactam-biosynthetic de-N-acetylase [Gorillibacterium sp. CAU 1737]|uniref:delta-lactam-biosynthetic de-N-acetylase n=1 Tax=Gorillibacterium sp. CAU 1737 TaxID=3140362 RepID=UPI003261425F
MPSRFRSPGIAALAGFLLIGSLPLTAMTGSHASSAARQQAAARPSAVSALAPSRSAAADGAFHFGFKRSKGGVPASIDEEGFKSILQQHSAIFRGQSLPGGSGKELYLTFDNGYENGYTPPILDTLRNKKVPAIFFLTGHYVLSKPELVKRMAAEGHLVGNHSWSHPDMTQVSDAKIREELAKVKEAVVKLTGKPDMAYLRPPRGIFNERVLRVSAEEGYSNVFWSVAYKDWDPNEQRGAEYAYRQVMAQLHPGAVILLHSVSRDNAEALGRIIDDARKLGYEFKSLDSIATRTY